jgi:hypothetical protein
MPDDQEVGHNVSRLHGRASEHVVEKDYQDQEVKYRGPSGSVRPSLYDKVRCKIYRRTLIETAPV